MYNRSSIHECSIRLMFIRRTIIRSWGGRGSWLDGKLITAADTREVHQRA